MKLIKNGLVYTVAKKEPEYLDILIDGAKIVKVEKDIVVSEDVEVIDARGYRIYPGFVEAHCHLGMQESAIGFEGQDSNEITDPITPQLRGIDGINPMDETFLEAARAGVTCVATGPGSANVIGGLFSVIKTAGHRIDDMIVLEKAAMKCAFGENPKRVYRDKGNYSRMSTAAKLRETLLKTIDYDQRKQLAKGDPAKMPAWDMKLEAMLPVIHKEIPLKAHAHQANDIFTAIRIAREFDLKMTLEHVTDGALIIDELVHENIPLAIGPSFHARSKFECKNLSFDCPVALSKAGLPISLITDSPVVPLHYLPMCAGLAIQHGMDEAKALEAITINPARLLGVDDRVGTIELGKDADLVMTTTDPFDILESVTRVFINGIEI